MKEVRAHMAELIECVPNISEGRRADVVDAIAESLSKVPGALLLNYSSDPDHNRSVLTMAGTRAGLMEAVRRLYAAALERIDLREERRGEHPRMGVVDVVPFIPVRGAGMQDCVELAQAAGEMVANEFGVPVFLYGEAASASDRRVLANIRRGEFEGMAEKMMMPEWFPDFGPNRPHPTAGVSAFGARFFLIAYNIQLNTDNIEVAKAIARVVRESSGGLKHVQAVGFSLTERRQAQVSMNLLNFEKTPIHRVHEAVKSAASRLGAKVVSSELVGLVPQTALLSTAAHYLQIENFSEKLVLENAILSAWEQGKAAAAE